MHISGNIHQIRSEFNEKSYLNIGYDDYPLAVSAWGNCYSNPTYLCQTGYSFVLIAFDDQASADEWMGANAKNWVHIQRLDKDAE